MQQAKMARAAAAAVITITGLGASACAPPSPIGIDPAEVRPIESALSLDPRIQHGGRSPGLPPITGGTLIVTARDVAVVSDPDRDRVLTVDLVTRRILGTIAVPGGQPGRIAEDAAGRAHVLLRGSGEVLSFDPERPREATRTAVCTHPRGIAFDAEADALRIVCRDGLLLSMTTEGTITERLDTGEDDLRDVVAVASGLVVSRFRAAELVALGDDGAARARVRPILSVEGFDREGSPVEFVPEVAWRVAVHGDLLAVAHQRATDREIQLDQPDAYGGGGASAGFEDGLGARRSAPTCGMSGIVRSAVTVLSNDFRVLSTHHFAGATLPVDVAISPDQSHFALVAAGEQGLLPSVFERWVIGSSDPCSVGFGRTLQIPGPVAVAYDARGRLLVQQRDPARLWIDGVPVALGGEERFDTGHAIFHGNAGLGLACASCHPEGGDDGHVWSFAGFGALRTPALHGGILDTAPFHWNGDLPSIRALVNEVFERRMGGPSMDERAETALAQWVNELPVSVGRDTVDAAQVDRGARLFWGEAQCGSCHYGELYTNNQTVDVGTGGPLQVPSLVGVSFRLPVMHDGCARTLTERFDPACGGGDRHGRTSQLSPEQVSDLVAYLETL
ncbi:MAG: hypothetical protein OHK0013_08080 [Sandaracinaceae bacterium]